MGLVGIVAAVVFVKLIHSPMLHPAVNKAEVDYIEAGGGLVRMEEASASNGAAFTWANVKQVLTNRMLLGVYLGQYCINVLTYFFVTWFPIYLVKERGLSILQAGLHRRLAGPVRLRRRPSGRDDLGRPAEEDRQSLTSPARRRCCWAWCWPPASSSATSSSRSGWSS
jgi:hypothetical protein